MKMEKCQLEKSRRMKRKIRRNKESFMKMEKSQSERSRRIKRTIRRNKESSMKMEKISIGNIQ